MTSDEVQEVRVVSQEHTQAKRDENSIQILLCTHSGPDLEDRFVVAALKVAKTNAFAVCAAVLLYDRAPFPFLIMRKLVAETFSLRKSLRHSCSGISHFVISGARTLIRRSSNYV